MYKSLLRGLVSIHGPLLYPPSLHGGLIQTHGFEYHLCIDDLQIDTFNAGAYSPFPLVLLIGLSYLICLQSTLGPSPPTTCT